MSKLLRLQNLTEITHEFTLHDGGWRRFTMIINFVHGVPHIKYGVYRATLCISCTKDIEKAFERYVALERKRLFMFSNGKDVVEEGQSVDA